MGSWMLLVQVCLPIPVVLLPALAAPVPRSIKKVAFQLSDRVMSTNIIGHIPLAYFMLSVPAMAFLATAWRTYELKATPLDPLLSANQKTSALALRWRQERNFWLSLFTLVMWCMLLAVKNLVKRVMQLEWELDSLRPAPAKAAPRSGGSWFWPQAKPKSVESRADPAATKKPAATAAHTADSDVTPSAPPAPAAVPVKPVAAGTGPNVVKVSPASPLTGTEAKKTI